MHLKIRVASLISETLRKNTISTGLNKTNHKTGPTTDSNSQAQKK